MTTQKDFLSRLIALLDQGEIPYMIVGSLGSSFYGRPRATQDVDLVIDPSKDQFGFLLSLLEREGYYVSRHAAREALRRRAMFNVIDVEAGWKADLIVRKDRAFSGEEFQRRLCVDLGGQKWWLVSPEDAILSKLEWAKGRESEVQYADALAVAVAHLGRLDLQHLKKWAQELGVADMLTRLLWDAKSQAGGAE
jgi:hypothetical protein